MKIEIQDISPAFLGFWSKAKNQSLVKQKQLWRDEYVKPNQAIFDIYFSRYGHLKNLESALGRYAEIVDHIESFPSHIHQTIHRTAPLCTELFDKQSLELSLVLMVGVFNSDGWVTELDGKTTTFLALEVESNTKIEPIEITVAHEIVHAHHAQCSGLKINSTTVGEGLFFEGLAVFVSKLIVPDRKESAYLWPGGEKTVTGQSCDEWLEDCYRVQQVACQQLLGDLEESDENVYASYFWSRLYTQRPGIPLRIGYVIGYELIKRLYQKYSIAELASWSSDRVLIEVDQQLQLMADSKPV